MARWKTRSQKTQDSLISRYMKLRKSMVEICIALGLPDRAKPEDVVDAVKELVERDGEKKDKRAEP